MQPQNINILQSIVFPTELQSEWYDNIKICLWKYYEQYIEDICFKV